ncbi:hypothetical protein JCM11491_006191 [Sporobolomyces phaffii]
MHRDGRDYSPEPLEPQVDDPFQPFPRPPPRLAQFPPGTPRSEQIAWSNWVTRAIPRIVAFVRRAGPDLLPAEPRLRLFDDIAQSYRNFTLDVNTIVFEQPVPVYPGDHRHPVIPVEVHVQLPGVGLTCAHFVAPERFDVPAPADQIGLVRVPPHQAPVLLPRSSRVPVPVFEYRGPRFFELYDDTRGHVHQTTGYSHVDESAQQFEHGLLSGEARRPYTFQLNRDTWEAQDPLGTSQTRWQVELHDSRISLIITLVPP